MRTFALLAATLLSAVCLGAQDAPVAPSGPVLESTLTAKHPVVTPGDKIELTLTVQIHDATTLPATLLGGRDIDTFLDGQKAQSIRDVVDGEIKVAAGTRIERNIEIPTPESFPGVDLGKHSRVTFQWTGMPDAKATVRLVPNQKDLDLSTLDYEKTKVRLITSMGDIDLRFFHDLAPHHVENFVKLSRDGFYDGTRFHRVLRGFMIQGGDPNTKEGATGSPGTGGPGYTIDAEFNKTSHVRGILSMARGRDPNSAGSQFFIMHGDQKGLDGKYTAFGMVESGMDTVDKIANTEVRPTPQGEPSIPVEPVWLYAAVVEPVFKQQ